LGQVDSDLGQNEFVKYSCPIGFGNLDD